jgi:O-antigen/teichoic acid export membrane protein
MIKALDSFGGNLALVFLGTFLANSLNLFFQLIIAHKLTIVEFATFNSLLSILVLVSSPLTTLQFAVAKYVSAYNASNQAKKVKILLSGLFKKTLVLGLLSFLLFYIFSAPIALKLKISQVGYAHILAVLIGLSWINPLLSGGIQGLELFKPLALSSIITAASKLALAAMFLFTGLGVFGALDALVISSLIGLTLLYLPLGKFLAFECANEKEVDFLSFFKFIFPVAVGTFFFMAAVNLDMILVKYFFDPKYSGIYAIAQMPGKIFLFLPLAISLVMLPRVSGLKTKNQDTLATLGISLFLAFLLCITAIIIYNLFPAFILKIMTGKYSSDAVSLGRFFSVSMSFFALTYILLNYFFSIKDWRFLKFLCLFAFLELFSIIVWHRNIFQVQFLVCLNSILLFCSGFLLAYFKPRAR